jgi:hypothetical protein
MRHILNDCFTVALCDETHYMGHVISTAGMRRHFRHFAPLTDDAKVRRLVDHMLSPAFERYSLFKELGWQWSWFVKTVRPEVIRDTLLASDRSEAGIFDAFMGLYADHRGATVRGEKTPIHLRWAEELMVWYPNSKIIHMIRDPRAVHVSDLKRRREQKSRAPAYEVLRRLGSVFEIFTIIETTLMWSDSEKRARRMARLHPDRYIMVKFEDLIRAPQEVVPRLCSDLGIPFEEKMLDRTVVSAGFKKGDIGFDGPAAQRWSRHISGWAARWYGWYFKNALQRFGYET